MNKIVSKKMLFCLSAAVMFAMPLATFAASLEVPSAGIKSITEAMMKTRVGDTCLLYTSDAADE